jgi:hypothetical protein
MHLVKAFAIGAGLVYIGDWAAQNSGSFPASVQPYADKLAAGAALAAVLHFGLLTKS